MPPPLPKARRARILLWVDADGSGWTERHVADAYRCRIVPRIRVESLGATVVLVGGIRLRPGLLEPLVPGVAHTSFAIPVTGGTTSNRRLAQYFPRSTFGLDNELEGVNVVRRFATSPGSSLAA